MLQASLKRASVCLSHIHRPLSTSSQLSLLHLISSSLLLIAGVTAHHVGDVPLPTCSQGLLVPAAHADSATGDPVKRILLSEYPSKLGTRSLHNLDPKACFTLTLIRFMSQQCTQSREKSTAIPTYRNSFEFC